MLSKVVLSNFQDYQLIKNTLGTAIKAIKDKSNNNVDLTFLKPFETMYGLASNNGIRHAENEKQLSQIYLMQFWC